MVNQLNAQLINFKKEGLKASIYRVFSIQRLIEICSSKKNTLVRPKKWDDPFENFILTKAIEANPSSNPTIPVKDLFYGQCWSVLEESDAMWRIYSPEKNGVKVRTTVGKLLNSLRKASERKGKCFIGKVSYLRDDVLRKKLQDRSWLSAEIVDDTSKATSLLFKRREFAHEHEVRLLYLSSTPIPDDVFKYSADPLKLFDEIQFDPRISNELFEVYKYYLRTEVGFKKSIDKSKLYQVPNVTLKM